jgi:hypothetical protein
VLSGRSPCYLNSVSAILVTNFVWLTQRIALGREPSLSHDLIILLSVEICFGSLPIRYGRVISVCYVRNSCRRYSWL